MTRPGSSSPAPSSITCCRRRTRSPWSATSSTAPPRPKTSLGQKGSGEGGYLGAPAAVASAVNDALAPLGISLTELPMRLSDIEAAIHRKQEQTG